MPYWEKYLSNPERQKKYSFETMACTNFARNNGGEVIANCKKRKKIFSRDLIEWAKQEGYINHTTGNFDFSDRALAYWSDTEETGNYQRAVNKAAEKYGSVPEIMWPFPEPDKGENKVTWEEYYKEPPYSVKEQGEEWKARLDDVHEWERRENFNKRIKESPIIVCGFAWKSDDNGFYYRPEGRKANHAFLVIGKSKKKKGIEVYPVADTYPPFIKWVYADNINGGGYLVDIIELNNFNVMKFLKKHNQKLIRNKQTGAYGAIYKKKLYVPSQNRAGLFMIDREAKGLIGKTGVVQVSDKTWRNLPQVKF